MYIREGLLMRNGHKQCRALFLFKFSNFHIFKLFTLIFTGLSTVQPVHAHKGIANIGVWDYGRCASRANSAATGYCYSTTLTF